MTRPCKSIRENKKFREKIKTAKKKRKKITANQPPQQAPLL